MDCLGGWVPSLDTWTYASATTITVPSDATTKYSVGDKIRLKQGGGYKYFYVIAVASTTLTITGGDDYTLANSAITDNYYSKVVTPVGFPDWFDYTPTYTGFSTDPSGGYNRFRINGRTCIVERVTDVAGTSNSTVFNIAAPVTAANGPFNFWVGGIGFCSDNSSNQANPCRIFIQANTNNFTLEKAFNSNAWTSSGTKNAEFQFAYEI